VSPPKKFSTSLLGKDLVECIYLKGAWRNGRRNGLKVLSFGKVIYLKVSSQIQGSLSRKELIYDNPEPRLAKADKVQRLNGNYLEKEQGKERVQSSS
jgi:hypothetical protein